MDASPHIPFHAYPSSPDLEMRLRIILGRGIFERSSFKMFMRHTESRDIAVDVGSHVGSWALGLSKLFGNVIAFEPHPTNRVYLEANIRQAHAINITTYPHAVMNDVQQSFRITAENTTRNSGQMYLSPASSSPHNSLPVECVRLDDVLGDLALTRKINALKVDVEGAELSVIRSGTEIIQEHKPTILLEINGLSARFGVTSEQVLDHMSDIGYRHIDRHRYDFVFRPKYI